MIYPFRLILDTIFPPTKSQLLLRDVTFERFACWYQPVTRSDITHLSYYHHPEVQAAITACKFEHSYQGAKLLATIFSLYLENLPPKKTLLIAIPLSTIRQQKRGFNQVERVIRARTTTPYRANLCTTLLQKPFHTQPQTTLNRTARLNNMKNVFTVNKKDLFYLRDIERVIICDDVTTTGATLKAAKEALKPHLPQTTELICLAWAH